MSGERRGIVVSYDESRGFGFIRARGLPDDVFVHASSVIGGDALSPGQRVRFVVEGTDRGPRAVRVRPGATGLTPEVGSAAILLGLTCSAAVALRWAGLPWLPSWLVPINLATLAVWAWDKNRAVRAGRRVPEAALLWLAAIGGTIGAWIGVLGLGHKRRKGPFVAVLGVIAAVQLVVATLLLRP